jgi:hypothetical protein
MDCGMQLSQSIAVKAKPGTDSPYDPVPIAVCSLCPSPTMGFFCVQYLNYSNLISYNQCNGSLARRRANKNKATTMKIDNEFISHAIWAVVTGFALAAATNTNLYINVAAFISCWLIVIIIPLVQLGRAFYLGFNDDTDSVEYFRPLAEMPLNPAITTAKSVILFALMLFNAWWFTALTFLSVEVSCFLFIIAVRRFIALSKRGAV